MGGSIVLAAVVLKLGGYGVYRFLFLFISKLNIVFLFFVLMGGLICSLICLCQADIKALVAYSSVSHMAVVGVGLFTLGTLGVKSIFVIILGHGFCSSALFFLINYHYERNISRQLVIVRGQRSFILFLVVI